MFAFCPMVRSSQVGCLTIFCRIVHFLCCQELHPLAGLALPRSLACSSFLAASACPPESCFVRDKSNLEHGTILCGGTVGPVLLSIAMCAGSSQELWEHGQGAGQASWHSRRKTGGSKRTTYNVLCNEHFTANIVYGNGGPSKYRYTLEWSMSWVKNWRIWGQQTSTASDFITGFILAMMCFSFLNWIWSLPRNGCVGFRINPKWFHLIAALWCGCLHNCFFLWSV